MVKDVVCGMQVDEGQVASQGLTSSHHDQAYYFCSQQCKSRFDQEPQRYAEAPVAPAEAGADGQTGEWYIG
jgi:Cu+-exporting ATPase